ncbi:MAG: hypothetical protein E7391_03800 [Ruminococcaceae bacterium]|nr:hypothetical protein [Oscillospiraceae bacterium]
MARYTDEQRKELVERAYEELEKRGLSANKAEGLLGVSGSILSGLKNGNYRGNTDKYLEVLEKYFESVDYSISDKIDLDYVETSISRDIYERLKNCKNRGGMAVVCGDPGIGKTKTAFKFLNEDPERVIYIAVNPCMSTAEQLLKLVGKKLGLKKVSTSELWDSILNALPDKSIIIFDEAQFLPYRSIEVFRSMMDDKKNNGSILGIMFMGNIKTALKIKGDSVSDFAQISSRCRFPAIFSTKDVKKSDIIALFPEYENSPKELDFLLRVAQSREGIRNAVNLVLELKEAGLFDYESMIEMAKFMQLTI